MAQNHKKCVLFFDPTSLCIFLLHKKKLNSGVVVALSDVRDRPVIRQRGILISYILNRRIMKLTNKISLSG